MSKKQMWLKLTTIVVNLFIFLSTTVYVILGTGFGYIASENRFLGHPNTEYMRYFTTLSNIYNALVALLFVIFTIIYFKKDKVYEKWFKILYLSAVVSVMLTFFTVIFFLEPTMMAQGYDFLFLYWGMDYFLFHFLNPLLALVSFLFLFKGERINYKHIFITILPMVVYSFIYAPCVFLGAWPDFYGFTFGGQYYLVAIVFPIMLGATYGISFGINALSNLLDNKLRRKGELL